MCSSKAETEWADYFWPNLFYLLSLERLCRNHENAVFVILNEVKNLMHSISYTTQILRLTPQNDIATQSPMGEV